MALPRDFDLSVLLRTGQIRRERTAAGLAAVPDGVPPTPAAAAASANGATGTDARPSAEIRPPAQPPSPPVQDPPPADAAAQFLDPTDSRLRAAERILELAEDDDLPLLDRVRHLAATATSLDRTFADGDEATTVVRTGIARALVIRHAYCFHHAVLPTLARVGVELVRWDDLGKAERTSMGALFREAVYPVLTPFASANGASGGPTGGLHLAVLVKDPSSGAQTLAWVMVPPTLPRFVRTVRGDGTPWAVRLVPLEDVIATHLVRLFPGMQVIENHPFRLTSDRTGRPVRLEVEESITPEVLDVLLDEVGADGRDVHRVPGPLDLGGLAHVADLDRPDLEDPPFVPTTHPDLARAAGREPTEMFAVLRQRDVLLQHPYDSYATSVLALLDSAATDPNVLAIKLIVGGCDPRVREPLAAAAEAGKQVTVVVDRRTFGDGSPVLDERPPPAWVRTLAAAGCQIVYGVGEPRLHARGALIVRTEADGTVRRYCHLGTGDYRLTESQQREDLGLLTADREVADDLSDLFNHLTGYSRPAGYRRLLVGPRSLRPGLVSRIEREIGHRRSGRPARIRIKCNELTDKGVVQALYRASRFGVPVDIWVRGACVLRPQVPGLSETVRVRSVLGRFVEHSRVFAFDNGGDDEVWIGGADLVPADLDGRVEAYVRLAAAEHRRSVIRFIETAMEDGTSGWDLAADGRWIRRFPVEVKTP